MHIEWNYGAVIADVLTIICKWKTLQHIVLVNEGGQMPNIEQLKSFVNNLCKLRYLRIAGFTYDPPQLEQLCLNLADFLNVHRPLSKFSLVPLYRYLMYY